MRTIGIGSVEGRSIFMDTSTDSYFTIDPALEGDIEAMLEGGGLVQADDPLRSALGLTDEPARIVAPDYTIPTTSLLEKRHASHARLGDMVSVASLLFRMQRLLRLRPIHSLLAQGLAHEPIRDRQLIDLASRFLAARKLVPIKRNCLLDSLSLVRWLGGGQILFGVKLHPFAAHCWVQSGALILNDLTENVAAFTVVRVV
jgi:hypothetical protein